MAFVDIYNAATDDTSSLRKQTAVALYQAAVDILNEDEATENHAQRVAWARRTIADPPAMAAKAIWKVLENATIAADPVNATDNDVDFVALQVVPYLVKVA